MANVTVNDTAKRIMQLEAELTELGAGVNAHVINARKLLRAELAELRYMFTLEHATDASTVTIIAPMAIGNVYIVTYQDDQRTLQHRADCLLQAIELAEMLARKHGDTAQKRYWYTV